MTASARPGEQGIAPAAPARLSGGAPNGWLHGPRLSGKRATGIALYCFGIVLGVHGCAEVIREAKTSYVNVKSAIGSSEIEITLENSFVERYKNRATIDVAFTVDKSDRRPHPAVLDGDLHIAGRAPKIGLPIVAEIKNAAQDPGAVDLIRSVSGSAEPLRLVGAWRLWPEHFGTAPEVQGEYLPPGELTNPDHVFEIHPVTRVDYKNLLDSLRPVEGYRPGRADTVFRSLQGIQCRIVPTEITTTIVTAKGQLNDVEFLLEIAEEARQVAEDGSFVQATVFDLQGNQLAERVRMVFLKDTPPERALSGLRRGTRLHAFGLPRIDLSTVSWRVRNSKDNPELLNLTLPYEIVVVGVYTDRSSLSTASPDRSPT